MSDEEGEKMRCPECSLRDPTRFRLEDDEDYAAVLEHYLDEHPDSERLRDAIQGTYVETVCEDCERPFFSPVSVDRNGLHIEVYCPECEGKEMVRRLMAKSIKPREFVEYQADPIEDDLGEKTRGGRDD